MADLCFMRLKDFTISGGGGGGKLLKKNISYLENATEEMIM